MQHVAQFGHRSLRASRAGSDACRRGAALGIALAAAVGTIAAAAETTFETHAESLVEYDSNVFRVNSNDSLPVIDGKQVRQDTVISNILGGTGTYEFAQQKFQAEAEGRRLDYLDLPNLSHFEYNYGGSYIYRILDRIGGTIDYLESRRQSAFADRNAGQVATQLNFDRDRSGGITTKFLVVDDWTLDGGYRLHVLTTPVIGAPDLKLTEKTATGGVNYVGISRLSLGLSGTYGDGNYSGIADATRFKQYSGGVTVNYAATEISKFNLAAGYTSRKDSGFKGTSGFTGDLGYTREITAKTSGGITLLRHVISYAAGDNTVIETGGSAFLTWVPTEKTSVSTNYSYVASRFRDQGLPGSFEQNRRDRSQVVSLQAGYAVFRWLQVGSIMSYETRRSNVQLNQYNAASIGLNVTATWK